MAKRPQAAESQRRNGQPNGSDPAKQEAPSEFESFEDLTRKLLEVPKKELDALRKKKR